MEKIVSDEKEEQEVKNNIFMTFNDIVNHLCGEAQTPEYDVEFLVVAAKGVSLENPRDICQCFVDLANKPPHERQFDLFCAVVPYDLPIVKVQRKQYVGKPVRLSSLIPVAVTWGTDEEYNIVMNHLTELLIQITGVSDGEVFKHRLTKVIDAYFKPNTKNREHAHEDGSPCVCQQSPATIVDAILRYVSGTSYELKWDMVIFFRHNGVNLSALGLFNQILVCDDEGQELSLEMQGTGIPYGWSPADLSGEHPVRISELITHACTWTGGDEEQLAIFSFLSKILATITNGDEDNLYRQLEFCRNALHNTHLH